MSSASESSGSAPKSDEQSPHEEDTTATETDVGGEEEESPKEEECICSFFDQPHVPKTTLEEYLQKKLKENPLFANVLILDKDEDEVCIEKPSDDPSTSILVTGFGMRNMASLQDALKRQQRKRLFEFYETHKNDIEKDKEEEEQTVFEPKKEFTKRSTETETELSSASSDVSVQQDKVRYLMGLKVEGEEEAYPEEEDLIKHMFDKDLEDKFFYSQIATTKSAQLYLRTHRIFDFFQFMIAHILSEAPQNPITFILVLLNKILLYRAGTGTPPLLYERIHIVQLFKLMDRMNSGFIDKKQYVSGMTTLGICDYNKDPPLSEEGLVSQEVFVQEALEAEIALFNDLIKRKWTGGKPKLQEPFVGISTPIRSYTSGFHLLPPDMAKVEKRMKIPEENEEG